VVEYAGRKGIRAHRLLLWILNRRFGESFNYFFATYLCFKRSDITHITNPSYISDLVLCIFTFFYLRNPEVN
jgi:hypothetical protein